MVGRVSVREPISEDAVDERGVAEFGAGPQDGEVVGCVGHGFRTTGYDGGCVARHDGLGPEDDGFEARGTDFVDRCTDCRVGESCTNGALPRWVLSQTKGKM